MSRRRPRIVRGTRRLQTNWVGFSDEQAVDIPTNPNGITLALDASIAPMNSAGLGVEHVVVRIVGDILVHQPVTVAGTSTICMATMGIKLQEHDASGLVYDENVANPLLLDDAWMYYREQPIGSTKVAGTTSAADESNSACLPSGAHLDVKVSRKWAVGEKFLVLMMSVTPLQGWADPTDWRYRMRLRILYRDAAR